MLWDYKYFVALNFNSNCTNCETYNTWQFLNKVSRENMTNFLNISFHDVMQIKIVLNAHEESFCFEYNI